MQGPTLSSYQPLSSSAQGCIVWGFFPSLYHPHPASLLSFKLPAVTEMSLGLKMATVKSSPNLPFPKCFLGTHWQTSSQGAERAGPCFPTLPQAPPLFCLYYAPPPSASANEWAVAGGWQRNEAMPLPSFSTIPARQVQSSKLSRFHMCLSPRGLASTQRSKVQPRGSDGSPVLSWPECRQSSLGLRWCFLSTSSLPAKIRLSSSSCPSPAFLSFYSRLRQFFVKGRGCGVVFSFFIFFFAQIFNLLQSAPLRSLSAPNCCLL